MPPNASMMFAPYRRYLALFAMLTATILPEVCVFAQGVATIVQTVKPANPGLTWQVPAAVPFGTAISNLQLDATATTAGTFTYMPAEGTILPPGANTLSVSFRPDNPNFLTAMLTVPLSVLPSQAHGFSFVVAPASADRGPFVLQGGETAPIHFTVAELLSFDQTLTFTCSSPLKDIRCVFTPPTAQVLKQPLDVSLVVQLVSEIGQTDPESVFHGSGGGVPANGPTHAAAILTSALLSASILGSGLRRRRFARMASRCRATMLAISVSGLLLGCGSRGSFERSEQLLIVATSPYESHSVAITVVIEQIGIDGGRKPTGH